MACMYSYIYIHMYMCLDPLGGWIVWRYQALKEAPVQGVLAYFAAFRPATTVGSIGIDPKEVRCT